MDNDKKYFFNNIIVRWILIMRLKKFNNDEKVKNNR
jgi:hypothetical protein